MADGSVIVESYNNWSVSNPPQLLVPNFGISFLTTMFSLFNLFLT